MVIENADRSSVCLVQDCDPGTNNNIERTINISGFEIHGVAKSQTRLNF